MNATEENVFAAVLEEIMDAHEVASLAELSERVRAAGYPHQDLDYWLARTHPDARRFFEGIDMTLVASLEKALALSEGEASRLAVAYVLNRDSDFSYLDSR